MSDISLSPAMRQNLLSLQQTTKQMGVTQQRLSTGLKVNSALDNPINYFTALGHRSSASELASYGDSMGEGTQTVKAATTGIEKINSLLASAKSLATSAKSASTSTGYTTEKLTVTGNFTAEGTITLKNDAGTTVLEEGTDFDAVAGDTTQTAINIAAAINGATSDVKVTAINGSEITLARKTNVDLAVGDIVVSDTDNTKETTIKANTDRNNLMDQFNEILSQINSLVDDSGYKGSNLLNNEDLEIKFSSAGSISISGFNAKTTGDLAVAAQTDWSDNTDIETALESIATAVDTLKSKASVLSSSLSVINIRQDFTSAMINTLTEGADQLTVADVNEEGANMLMLQTRQALSTTSLSLAAQASQSVLRLFQ